MTRILDDRFRPEPRSRPLFTIFVLARDWNRMEAEDVQRDEEEEP